MNEHRAAIDAQHRDARIASATTDDDKKLASVEIAVIASQAALETEEAQMRADGKYADGYIDNHMQQRKQQSFAYIAKLKGDVVDPIAKRVEQQAIDTAPVMPERTAIHIEASAHYSALDSDRRQEAIGRAITGKDDVLAVALLTGRDLLTDVTIDQLKRRIAPDDKSERETILKMAERVQATLNTIEGANHDR